MRGFAVAAAVTLFVGATCVVLAAFLYHQIYADRIFPGARLADELGAADLGGQDPALAQKMVAAPYERYLAGRFIVRSGGKEWATTPRELGLRVDTQPTLDAALAFGRSQRLLDRVQQQAVGLRVGVTLPPPAASVDEARIAEFVGRLPEQIDGGSTRAELALQAGGKVVVLPSQAGRKLNVAQSIAAIRRALLSFTTEPVDLVVDAVAAPIAEGDLEELRRLAEKAVGSPVVLETTIEGEPRRWNIERMDLAEIVSLRTSGTTPPLYELGFDENKIRAHVERAAADIERAAQEPRYVREGEGLRTVAPGQEGRRVEVTTAIARVRQAIGSDVRRVQVPWQPVMPAYAESAVTAQTFPELIEKATTVYGGTLPERVHNVELAAQRLNGVIVPPGATFSFNEAVGEVSYRSGYKRGYGIAQDGEDVVTIPSEGGGICQVATTLFQSVFWGGYQVVERNWHLYWIPRYGQRPRGLKGLDATIDQVYDKDGKLLYAVDLRWRNNTAAPVLINAETDGKNLSVTLWGYKPDWQVKVAEPKIDKVVKADTRKVRQPDAALRPGQELMIEHAEDGFQATIVRTILRDGKIADESRLVSTYRPSRNVYLVGGSPTASDAGRSEDRPATPAPPANGTPTLVTPVPSVEPTETPRVSSTVTPRTSATPAPSGTARASTTPRVATATATRRPSP